MTHKLLEINSFHTQHWYCRLHMKMQKRAASLRVCQQSTNKWDKSGRKSVFGHEDKDMVKMEEMEVEEKATRMI